MRKSPPQKDDGLSSRGDFDDKGTLSTKTARKQLRIVARVKTPPIEFQVDLFATAVEYHRSGDYAMAVKWYDRMLTSQPGISKGWKQRGDALKDLEKIQSACLSYRKAAETEENKKMASKYEAMAIHFEAVIDPNNAMARASDEYIAALFDDFAPTYNRVLLNDLKYVGHKNVVRVAKQLLKLKPSSSRVLDLGCGTGLVGTLIADMCSHLTGIDLSEQMLSRAKSLNIYDSLIHGEILNVLESHSLGAAWNIIFAADVLVYVGDLEQIVATIVSRKLLSYEDGLFVALLIHMEVLDAKISGTNTRSGK
eukprot:g9972.t1